MPRGRPLTPLVLSEADRDQWPALAPSTAQPQGLVQRARIVLAGAEGGSNRAVAEQVGVSWPTGGQGRRRFLN